MRLLYVFLLFTLQKVHGTAVFCPETSDLRVCCCCDTYRLSGCAVHLAVRCVCDLRSELEFAVSLRCETGLCPADIENHGHYCSTANTRDTVRAHTQCCLTHWRCSQELRERNCSRTTPTYNYTCSYNSSCDMLDICEEGFCHCDRTVIDCISSNHPVTTQVEDNQPITSQTGTVTVLDQSTSTFTFHRVNDTLNETLSNFTNELVLFNSSQSSNILSTKYPAIFQSGPEEEENEAEERDMDRNSERGSIVEREEEEAVKYEDVTAVLTTEEPGRDKKEEEILTTHNAMEWTTHNKLTVSIALTTTTESQTVTELPDTYTNTHSPHYTTHTQSHHHSSEEDDDESDGDTLQSAASNTSKPVTHTPAYTTHTSGAHTTTNYLSNIAKPYVKEEQEMTESDRETEEHSTAYIVLMTTPTKIATNQNSYHKTTPPTATNKNTVAATTLVQLPFMKGSKDKEILFEEKKSEEDKETDRESDLIVNKSEESSAEQPADLSTTKPKTQTQANTKPSQEDERHEKASKEDLQSDEEEGESVKTQTTVIPSSVREASPSTWIIPAMFPKPPVYSGSPRPTAHTAAQPTKNHKTTSTVPHTPVSTRTTTSGHAAVETAAHPQKPPRPVLDRSPSLTTTAQQESAEEDEQEKEEEPSDSSQESEKIESHRVRRRAALLFAWSLDLQQQQGDSEECSTSFLQYSASGQVLRDMSALGEMLYCLTGRCPHEYQHYACYCGQETQCCFLQQCCLEQLSVLGCRKNRKLNTHISCHKGKPQCSGVSVCDRLQCICDHSTAECMAASHFNHSVTSLCSGPRPPCHRKSHSSAQSANQDSTRPQINTQNQSNTHNEAVL
uniref:Otoconin 90 n=1 Tax=Sinocyclocheilus anshuiensis TaxID=1608454 RepID=A0A671N7L0_9TELE